MKKTNCSQIRKLSQKILAVSSICFCGFDEAGFYLPGRTIWEKLSEKRRFFPSTCLDREQNNFGHVDKFSSKDVKTSFYESTRTIGGIFCLKLCKISTFLWSLSKNSVEQSREEASQRFVGNFCHQQRYTEEALLTFPKVCAFEKQNISQASRSFFRSFLSDSNRSFCLWDILSVHAIVWQRVHLRPLKLKRWRINK